MRATLSHALHKLVAETRENPEPVFAAQAVAQLADAWAQSALAMVAAASSASVAAVHASPEVTAATTQPTQPDDVHAAMLASLRLIVDGAREGQADIEVDCHRFADTFSACLRDAIAGAYLRAASAFEEQLGISPGIAN
jgi:hypothetical protein